MNHTACFPSFSLWDSILLYPIHIFLPTASKDIQQTFSSSFRQRTRASATVKPGFERKSFLKVQEVLSKSSSVRKASETMTAIWGSERLEAILNVRNPFEKSNEKILKLEIDFEGMKTSSESLRRLLVTSGSCTRSSYRLSSAEATMTVVPISVQCVWRWLAAWSSTDTDAAASADQQANLIESPTQSDLNFHFPRSPAMRSHQS